LVLGSGFSVLGARGWIHWRILTSLQVLVDPCGSADGAIDELEEFCVLFSGQILEIERVVQVILCCRTMRMSGTPKNKTPCKLHLACLKPSPCYRALRQR